MSQHIALPSYFNDLAGEWRHRRPHYKGPRYPIPPWHEDCVNDDPVIVSEFDFSDYAAEIAAIYKTLYVDEWGWLRLDVRRLAIEVVQLKVEMEAPDEAG